jgi:hypothetical protein
MTRKRPKVINILEKAIKFRVGAEAPTVFPPGHYATDEECSATPPLEPELEDDFMALDDALEDMAMGRYEENGSEKGNYPVGYDDFHFDIMPDEEVQNHVLYRWYDVFLYKDPNTRGSQQFYVLHDYEYGPNDEVVIIPNRYAVVALLNVYII